tara:strand:- start:582 stop:1172 length:591 start_codon:yes stop_codon:yes gene_type:complete
MSNAEISADPPMDEVGALLTRVADKDRAAFTSLYSATAPKLLGVLVRILQNRAEAEDALQDVFIKTWQRAPQFAAQRGSGMGWMVAVTRNHALDRLRARPESRGFHQASDRSGQDPLDTVADGRVSAESTLIARGEARRVLTCLEELESERAQAVRGAYLAGLSYKELAERHGVALNTMRTWLRRGLLALRECIER